MKENFIEIAKVTFCYGSEESTEFLNTSVEGEYDISEEAEKFVSCLSSNDLIDEDDIENDEVEISVDAINYRISSEYGSFERLKDKGRDVLNDLLSKHAERVNGICFTTCIDSDV